MSHELTLQQQYLVMATARLGVKRGVTCANGRNVLRQAMLWAGCWNPEYEPHQTLDVDDPIVDEWYWAAVRLAEGDPSTVLMKTYGNVPSIASPGCHPTYAGFELTKSGWRMAETLFRDHPEFDTIAGPDSKLP